MSNPQWQHCLQLLQQSLPPKEYETWFTPLRFGSLKGHTLTLVAPRKFVMEHIIKEQALVLQQCVAGSFGEGTRVLFNVDENMSQEVRVPTSQASAIGTKTPAST